MTAPENLQEPRCYRIWKGVNAISSCRSTNFKKILKAEIRTVSKDPVSPTLDTPRLPAGGRVSFPAVIWPFLNLRWSCLLRHLVSPPVNEGVKLEQRFF